MFVFFKKLGNIDQAVKEYGFVTLVSKNISL